ncbi:MAG: thioredoxin family protein [Deltaproteobacteria bacterium]|jgi:thiol:disulfide interchange protein DsbD|nr:thioredoxin family protein [Deltaproteobacteria bacterium]
MNLLNKYDVFLTAIKRGAFTYGWALFLAAMVPLSANAKDRVDIGNLLQDAGAPKDEVVQLETAWSVDRARPADTVTLAVVLDIKDGFHINADVAQIKPIEDLKLYPTQVQVLAASEGVGIAGARYPQAKPFKAEYASEELMAFDGRAIITLSMKLDEQIPLGSIGLDLQVEYQACSDRFCLFPEKKKLHVTLAVVAVGTPISQVNSELFANLDLSPRDSVAGGINFSLFDWEFSVNPESGVGRIALLLVAALGGMLLNLTPCVLPLIPIKIISLSHAAEDRRRCFFLGQMMSLGVLAFWVVLGILIALVSDFTATNQLFQYPLFTILVGALIAIMALGMFGFFSLRLPQFIYMINPQQNSVQGSFALGILAAVLSTPCTAPFMGAAAAWAATQTPLITLTTFAAIGGGMALPYLLLSAFPNLVNRMPKAGPASELIKQVMGLFMLAAAAYFVGVGISALLSSPPNPPSKIFWWPVMILVSAGGAWLALRTLQLASRNITKTVLVGLGLILIAVPIWGAVRLADKGPIDWIHYTPERFETAIGQKKVVLMDFTAEWCLNCKALEEGVLHDRRVVDALAKTDVVPMKVDITGNNPAGKAKLKEVGSLTVPLLVVVSPGGQLVFKSDFYTVEQVLEAIREALGRKEPAG